MLSDRATAEVRGSAAYILMAEAFELVRIVRQHIRRSAMLLDQGKLSDALAEADAALALDPQSLPAQMMRARITNARSSAPAAVRPGATGRQAPSTPRSFVPYGVNAASWRGFEQRITERRFKALLEIVNTSIVAGDGMAARAALAEARELKPDAPVLAEFEARVAAVPVASPASASPSAPRIWMRAMGAAALFLVGVSLLLGLEWMQPGAQTDRAPLAPAAAPAVPVAAPVPAPVHEMPPAPSPNIGSVPVALNDDEETIPAVVTPPEPILRPAGTSGATTGSSTPASSAPAASSPANTAPPRPAPAPAIAANSTPAGIDAAPERRVAETPSRSARTEVSDDFVAPRRALVVAPDTGPTVSPTARAPIDTPVTATARGATPAAAETVSPAAITIPSSIDQQTRVEEVLRRYARAYDRLDASAARAVWPTVDERALARAFQNLSSQNVSLEDCEIDIRGAVANASCRGQASYAPKVGNREPRTEARNWRFELRREGDAWQIVDVEARRRNLAYR